MSEKPISMGLQLFPPPPSKKKPWKGNSNEGNNSKAGLDIANPSQSHGMFNNGRQSPSNGQRTPQDGRASPMNMPPPPYLHQNVPGLTLHSRKHLPLDQRGEPWSGQSNVVRPTSPGLVGRGLQDETWPEPSSSAELKELWKVTNGWKASASEGQKFIMKMNSAVEEPIHTLSSATQPFYTIRLDPTSTSAQVTMTRQNPAKSPRKSQSPKTGVFPKGDSHMEVLITTLEEYSRRLPQTMAWSLSSTLTQPRVLAADLAGRSNVADSALVLAAAERECGRLLWDDDTKKFYLRHPAVSTPFLIAINSSPAWSRVEYTLEHPELPHNLVRLVRDGSGTGFLEVDTGVAARIDAFYIVDVAIAAVMLAAMDEEKRMHIERFEAPPAAPVQPDTPRSKRRSFLRGGQMELDVESQESPKYKTVPTKEKDKDKKKSQDSVACFG
ncbi:hypothetical protein DID88_008570 [Monilinia fructigena]|uniref:Uncharacterized protein n=1 Tax=Monilinia fructigena TaxID=38457 RepID=A0A395J6U7_9HELO|nr:hypothetical protein DID88_008570 [Monilinia fructigena]